MSYYFEVWLRGFAKDHLRALSTKDTEGYHPHITFVRPFQTREEDAVQAQIIGLCKGIAPIPFSLEGASHLDTPQGRFHTVPVTRAQRLLQFDSSLEAVLEGNVDFITKLNEKKILHATVPADKPLAPITRVDQYMLRLTGIKNKRIWFSYDFVTQEVLDRQESLDKKRWLQTVNAFTNQTGLMPTRQGYKRIA